MTISVQRLTLFAIFDSLERDLRSVLVSEILPYHYLNSVLNDNELSKVSDRLKQNEGYKSVDLEEPERFVQYLDLLDTVHIINRNKKKITPTLGRYFSGITAILEKCAPVRNAVMHGRPLEIDDFPTICGIASKLVMDEEYDWPNVSETLSRIENDPDYVFGINFRIIDDSTSEIFHNLPIPEFDDTGFVGRRSILGKVESAISGPFPVISLTGPGGVGKTALALKSAYRLLSSERPSFDAIVWVSAKASTLTTKEIQRIEGAIEDSIGVFSTAMAEFQSTPLSDPEDGLVELLGSFRVLLIIDNLETVLDERLRRFIQKVPKGSKILLTSRIGVGTGDLSIEIPPLTMPESRVYFKKLVESYSVWTLQKIGAETLDRYIRRLISNPLFLKWFVTAVKSGSMPEKLLSDQTEILRFCLENVVEHLSGNAKQICNVFMVVDGPHSLPMLSQLSGLSPVDIESALASLITCNIITMTSVNDVGDTAYQMSTLPRAYLKRIYRISSEATAKDITKRYRRIQQTIEQADHYHGKDVYRLENFHIKNRDHAIVVVELKKAFSLIRQKRFDSAEGLLLELSGIAPGYFEIERVKAYLKFETKEYVAAKRAYEMALELNPDYGPLHYWYGGFLLRAYDDLDNALNSFQRAFELEPSSLVRREQARVLMYKGMFNESVEIIDELLRSEDLRSRHGAILSDLKIQCYCRSFEHFMDIGEWKLAVEILVAAQEHGNSIPSNVFDERMALKYRSIMSRAETLSLRLGGTDEEEVIQEFLMWTRELADRGVRIGRIGRVNAGDRGQFESAGSSEDDDGGPELFEGCEVEGFVVRIATSREFGFIRTTGGSELFFHQSSVVTRSQCLYMGIGVIVECKVGTNAKGYCGKDVRLKFSKNLEDLVGTEKMVSACVVDRSKNSTYGFAIISQYGSVLIRQDDLLTPKEWNMLKEGDTVELRVEKNENGYIGKQIALAVT